MDSQKIIKFLNTFPFFDGFSDDEKMILASFESYILSFTNRKLIIKQEENDHSVFFLLKGQAQVTKNEHPGILLNTMKPGAVFGEMSYLAKRPRSTNVIAVGDVIVLRMDEELLNAVRPVTQLKFLDQFNKTLIAMIDRNDRSIIKVKEEMEEIQKKSQDIQKSLKDLRDLPNQSELNMNNVFNALTAMQNKTQKIIQEMNQLFDK